MTQAVAVSAARTGILRVVPLAGETTWSLMQRTAAGYGMDAEALLGHWQWRNHRPRHGGSGVRADAEVLLDAAGRELLAGLCRVKREVLARALPSWDREEKALTVHGGGGVSS